MFVQNKKREHGSRGKMSGGKEKEKKGLNYEDGGQQTPEKWGSLKVLWPKVKGGLREKTQRAGGGKIRGK